MQDAQARQDFVLDQMQREAVKVGTAAMAMPGAGLLIDHAVLLQRIRYTACTPKRGRFFDGRLFGANFIYRKETSIVILSERRIFRLLTCDLATKATISAVSAQAVCRRWMRPCSSSGAAI